MTNPNEKLSTTAAIGVIGFLLLATQATAGPTDAEKCQAVIQRAIGKAVACRMNAEAKYTATGDAALRTTALAKCEGKLTIAYGKATATFGAACPVVATASEIDTYLGGCMDDVNGATAGDPLPDRAAELAACNAALAARTQDLATCSGALATCNGSLGTCNGNLTTCTSSLGTCVAALAACNGGGGCIPTTEICDGVDNNCDGTVDEGCICTPNAVTPCYTGPGGTAGVGICHAGTHQCNADGTAYGPCFGEVTPFPTEDCATPVDDDCDGQVNEADEEICGDGIDQDCNGHDDPCVCEPDVPIPCFDGPGRPNVGICHTGAKICNRSGTAYSACSGEVTAIPEDCSTPVDDNCDGQVNEGCP